jgi:multidrug efflux pump subunit AcrB
MAAGTTILGMAPLLPDPMFGGMAVAIMGGLFVSTLLTIIVLPAFYSVFFGLKKTEGKTVLQSESTEKKPSKY